MNRSTTFLHLRSSLGYWHQAAVSSSSTFLHPVVVMSRRSTRLSGHQSTSIPRAFTRYGSNAVPGPSLLPAREHASRIDAAQAVPYFEEWSTEALQAEVKRYGFKVSRKRATLIDQLKAVYQALHHSKVPFEAPTTRILPLEPSGPPDEIPEARGNQELILPALAASKATRRNTKGKGRKSDPFVVLDNSSESSVLSDSPSLSRAKGQEVAEEEVGDYTAQLELEALSATDGEASSDSLSSLLPLSASASPQKARRARSKSTASSSSAEIPLSTLTSAAAAEGSEAEVGGGGIEVDPSPALAQTMTTAIRSDPSVWERILRYEPISFDEVISIATQSGLAMDTGKRKEELRTWLDRQCICFYSAELTGSRSRH